MGEVRPGNTPVRFVARSRCGRARCGCQKTAAGLENSISLFESIRFNSLCESIRIYSFCKKNRPFDLLAVMQFF